MMAKVAPPLKKRSSSTSETTRHLDLVLTPCFLESMKEPREHENEPSKAEYPPQPPTSALAVPTQFLSKNAEVHAWHGTKVAPRIPMKNLNTYRPSAVRAVPANPLGMAPKMRRHAITLRGPYLSTKGPTPARTTKVAHKAMTLELATWAAERWRSDLIASGIKGGRRTRKGRLRRSRLHWVGGEANRKVEKIWLVK